MASQTVPVLEQHLSRAKQVAAQVGADTSGTTMTSHAEQAASSRQQGLDSRDGGPSAALVRHRVARM